MDNRTVDLDDDPPEVARESLDTEDTATHALDALDQVSLDDRSAAWR